MSRNISEVSSFDLFVSFFVREKAYIYIQLISGGEMFLEKGERLLCGYCFSGTKGAVVSLREKVAGSDDTKNSIRSTNVGAYT